ncbi:MAG: hypothetical protein IPO35_04525 [Uliginosibacterium sp.]|nr:hypothetical protein [Uliginosibacterium sp.]
MLSSPEDGSGIPEYKQVLRTFVYEQKTIVKIAVATEDPATSETIAATGNHPFWVEGSGWTRADALTTGSLLRKADGDSVAVVRQRAVYRTGRDGVGWVADSKNIAESHGSVFDYANYAVVERREEDKISLMKYWKAKIRI